MAATEYEGTIVSVDRATRTFRLRDSERGTIRIRVTGATRYERLAGFRSLRARDDADRVHGPAHERALDRHLRRALGRRRPPRRRRLIPNERREETPMRRVLLAVALTAGLMAGLTVALDGSASEGGSATTPTTSDHDHPDDLHDTRGDDDDRGRSARRGRPRRSA